MFLSQKREESGVNTSSPRMRLRLRPAEFELGVGDDDAAHRAQTAAVDIELDDSFPPVRYASEPTRRTGLRKRDIVVPALQLRGGVRSARASRPIAHPAGSAMPQTCRSAGIPSSRSRRGNRARCTRWARFSTCAPACCAVPTARETGVVDVGYTSIPADEMVAQRLAAHHIAQALKPE